MSIAEQARREGFEVALQMDGIALQILPGEDRICGLLNINPLEVPPDIYFDDPREKALFETMRSPYSAKLGSQGRLQDKEGNTWAVVRRDDNPSTFTVKFWLAKIVPGADT